MGNKPLGDAPGYKAGTGGNPWEGIAKPLISMGQKIVSAEYARRQGLQKEEAPAPEEPTATATAPAAAPSTTKADVWKNIAAAKASIKRNPDHFLPKAAAPGSQPTSLNEVPGFAVNKAMTNYHRGQVSSAIHRASSSIQFKNHG